MRLYKIRITGNRARVGFYILFKFLCICISVEKVQRVQVDVACKVLAVAEARLCFETP